MRKHRQTNTYARMATRFPSGRFLKENCPEFRSDINGWKALMLQLKMDRRHRRVLTFKGDGPDEIHK